MRQLTIKQKKYIDRISTMRTLQDVNDLEYEEYQELEKMNDTEILYQEIDRYISDKYFTMKFN